MNDRAVRRIAYVVASLMFGFGIPGLLFFAVGLAPMRWLVWGPGFDGRMPIYFAVGYGFTSGVIVVVWAYAIYTKREQRIHSLLAMSAIVQGLCGGSILGARWWQPVGFAHLVWPVLTLSALVGLVGTWLLLRTRWSSAVTVRFDVKAR